MYKKDKSLPYNMTHQERLAFLTAEPAEFTYDVKIRRAEAAALIAQELMKDLADDVEADYYKQAEAIQKNEQEIRFINAEIRALTHSLNERKSELKMQKKDAVFAVSQDAAISEWHAEALLALPFNPRKAAQRIQHIW